MRFLLLLALLSLPVSVQAEDKLWSAVVLATNAAQPKAAPAELSEFAPRLKRVFGYNQMELVGSAAAPLGADDTLLAPTADFSFKVRARRTTSKEARGGYLLNLQLFLGKRLLVDTEAKLAPGSPFFIRGPQSGKGQIIIVLQVQQ